MSVPTLESFEPPFVTPFDMLLAGVGEQEWAQQIAHMRELFASAAHAVGIEYFTYQIVHCPIAGAARVVTETISTFPPEWQHLCADDASGETNPVLARVHAEQEPFTWSRFALITDLSKRQREFFTEAHEAGLGSCITFPIHGQGETAALSVVPYADRREEAHRNMHLLYLMAHYLHQKARRPLAEVSLAVSSRRRSLLSPRETEVLEWIARGKSTSEIAALIGISDKGVDFHVEGAKQKLQASNRVHAVAKALVLKLLFAAD